MRARLAAHATWRRPLVWAGVTALAAFALCFVPLFDLLGYEFALALALLGSLGAGHVAAAYPQRVRDQLAPFPGARWTVLRLYLVSAGLGLALLVLPLAFISANALRVRNCDYLEGLAFFALGPVASVLVASAIGLAAGLATPGSRSASTLWVLVWVGGIALQLWLVFSTPAVRALGTFHGYFSGVLYDESVSVPAALLTLRARDLFVVAALLALSSCAIDRSRLRLSPRALRACRRPVAVAAAGLLSVAVAGFVLGPELGHRRSASAVARALGGRTVHERCVLVHPRSLPAERALLLARDCSFRLEQVETYFGTRFEGELTVFLFRDSEQKQQLIGAGHTSVAKPWRREVYVQGEGFPHPVLRHEIAHIVTGDFGESPLRISGRFGGVWVSPGLIEGAAVAADWDEGALSPHGWSRAMMELGIAPEIGSVVGLRFLTVNPGRAYVVAGSFVRFLVETRGAERFRRAYATADIEGAYGETLERLGREWREHLANVPFHESDLVLARERFDRPAVFAKVCAHEVAQLRERAERAEAASDWTEALGLRRRVVECTGEAPPSRLELARTLVAAERRQRARAMLDELAAEPEASRGVGRAARQLRADLDWARGEGALALAAYEELLGEADFPAARRMLQVKVSALRTERAAPHLSRFLLGGRRFGAEEPDLALLTLAELVAELPDYGVGHYLLGRQLWMRDEHARAIPYLERASRLGLPSSELDAEARLVLGIARFRAGRLDAARRTFEGLARNGELAEGLRIEAEDWIARCAWEAAHPRGR